MKTVNIHEAKTQLSKLVQAASKGEPFIIAKAGKQVVKVNALTAPNNDQCTGRDQAVLPWKPLRIAESQCASIGTGAEASIRWRLTTCAIF